MTNKDLIYIRGTGEPPPYDNGYPRGMLEGVAREVDRIAPGEFRHLSVPYWAQYAGPHSYGNSRAQAEYLAKRLLDKANGGRVIGYSMGAAAAGNVARDRDDVPCGYLLADPLRPRGANATGKPGDRGWQPRETFSGWGISGERTVEVARWYTLPDDIIADAFDDNLVRTFADISEYIGFAELDDAEEAMLDILGKIKRKSWQNLPWLKRLVSNPESLFNLPGDVKRTFDQGLMYPGRHVAYGHEKYRNTGLTYIQLMALNIVNDARGIS